jgi:YD repeat-containing protein
MNLTKCFTRRSFLPLILVPLIFTQNAAGQSTDLPKLIRPSPEASALFRFQDYPVDYSTGLISINVPIYEVKSGSLSVPVSISYHASGRRVYDQDGPVSLGWTLNAGGMVSRTVYGAVDFGTQAHGTYKFPYPFKTTNITNLNDYVYLENIMHFDKNAPAVSPGTWMDSEYDIFSYSFGSTSGKFIFTDNNNTKTPALIPYKPFVITPHYTSNGLTSIDIVDDKGILYNFIGSESYYNSGSNDNLYSGYALSKIISADKADTISFIYTAFTQTRTTINQQITLEDKNLMGFPDTGPVSTETTTHDPYQISRLTEIDFRQGKVLFNLVSGTDKIDNIQVMDDGNNNIRNIRLYRSYMDNLSEIGYATNKLDSLCFKDKNGVTIERYGFEYFPTAFANPTFNVRYRDWWGYYNASGVHDMVPYYTNLEYVTGNGGPIYNDYTVGNSGFMREPNLPGAESGVLKRITYPTGGNTEFVYELNRFHGITSGQTKNGPGLRIAQVKTTDNTGILNLRTFKYGLNESGYGILDMEPDITNMSTEQNVIYYPTNELGQPGSYRRRVFNSDFIPELSDLGSRPVIYTTVTEYHGTPTDNIGKTVYTYDYAGWAPSEMPAFENLTIPKKQIYDFNYWNVPSLIQQIDYKNVLVNGSITYAQRKKIDKYYNIVTTGTVNGLHIQRADEFPQAGLVNGDYTPPALHCEPYAERWAVPYTYAYTYSNYQIPIGYKNLSSETETLYNDDNSIISNTTSYSYNSREYLSQKTTTGSDGLVENTNFTYPFDYTGNTVLNQMASANMLSFPVEQTVSKNSSVLKATRINYSNWGTGMPLFAPQTVDAKKGSNAYETRLRYYGYDHYGNPQAVSRENDVVRSYIWDYKTTYPIAECVGADVTNIAYTSFESDGKGGWAFTGTPVSNPPSITGTKYYNLSTGSITKSGLNASLSFTISYWSKSASASVNGLSSTGLFSRNGWTYFEHKISPGSASVTVSGNVNIDDLRLYPSTAQMTTYTYAPLVGMTSKCDAAGHITYYDYDSYGRLQQIRDQDGNILKTFKYGYQSPNP